MMNYCKSGRKILAVILAAGLTLSGPGGVYAAETNTSLSEESAQTTGTEGTDLTAETEGTGQTAGTEGTDPTAETEVPMQEPETEEETPGTGADAAAAEIQMITGFAEFSVTGHYLYASHIEKPSESELIEEMPKTLQVYLEGSSQTREIPVSWYCCTEDYSSSEDYYYEFRPVFDGASYQLSNQISRRNIPYIGVFLSDAYSGGEITMEGEYSSSTMAFYNSVTTAPNEPVVYHYLVDTCHLSSAVACGLMANIEAESAFVSNNMQNSYEAALGYTDETYTQAVDDGSYTNFVHDSVGYGLMQWTFWSLKAKLYNFAREQGTSIGDLNMQLVFMLEESDAVSAFENHMTNLENSEDGAAQAAYNWCTYYERPSNTEERALSRADLARTYWEEYGDPDAEGTNGGIGIVGSEIIPDSTTGESQTSETKTSETSSQTQTGTYTSGEYQVTASSLNVRSGPDTSYSILGSLANGTKVTVTETSGRWGKITYKGNAGWISLAYCSKVTEAAGEKTSETASEKTSETASEKTSETASEKTSETTSEKASEAASEKTSETASEKTSETASDAADTAVYMVTASSLNVRSGPGTSYRILGSLANGTKVTVTEVSNGWGKINYSGKTGWISISYCTKVSGADPLSTEKTSESETASETAAAAGSETKTTSVYQVTASSLNVRSGPGTSYSRLGSLAKGTQVTVTEVSGKWGKITYNGKDGWISLDYCVKTSTDPARSTETAGSTETASSQTGTLYQVTASALNVRSGPGTSYSKLGSLANGTKVTVLAVENGWGKITYNGKTGYIMLSYCVKM